MDRQAARRLLYVVSLSNRRQKMPETVARPGSQLGPVPAARSGRVSAHGRLSPRGQSRWRSQRSASSRGAGRVAWVHAGCSSSRTGLRHSRPAAERTRLVTRLARCCSRAARAARWSSCSTINTLTLSRRISRTGVGARAAFQKDTSTMFRDHCH